MRVRFPVRSLLTVLGCASVAAPLSAGCGTNSNSPAVGGKASITSSSVSQTSPTSVLLTDAPFPTGGIATASVGITRVQLHAPTGALVPLLDAGSNEGDQEILSLTNGKTRSLSSANVPLGAYDSVHVTFSRAVLGLADGTELEATADVSEVDLPLALTASGGAATVLLDVDLSRSFVLTLGPDGVTPVGLSFHPTLRAALVGSGGTVSGQVLSGGAPVPGAVVTLVDASGNVVVTTLTDADGDYTFLEVPAGDYTTEAQAVGHTTTHTSDIQVSQNESRTAVIGLPPSTP
jgi:hypothetical protein